MLYYKQTDLLYSSPTLIAPEWRFDVHCSALWPRTLLCYILFPGRLWKWNGPLLFHFHGWLHVRCHFLWPISSILLPSGVKMSHELGHGCLGGVPLLFIFLTLQHVWYSNLNLLLLENDSGEKLLLCWIIQTLSFRGVSGLFSPLGVWAGTMSYVNNFGKSIGNSQENTAAHCAPVCWERLWRRKKREKLIFHTEWVRGGAEQNRAREETWPLLASRDGGQTEPNVWFHPALVSHPS